MLINIPSKQWVLNLRLWWLAISIISTDCLHPRPRLRKPEYGHRRNGMRVLRAVLIQFGRNQGIMSSFLSVLHVLCAQLIKCFVMIRKLPGASCTSCTSTSTTFPAMTRKMSQERPLPSVPCSHKCGYESQNNEYVLQIIMSMAGLKNAGIQGKNLCQCVFDNKSVKCFTAIM